MMTTPMTAKQATINIGNTIWESPIKLTPLWAGEASGSSCLPVYPDKRS
jgi:hypothetical protein